MTARWSLVSLGELVRLERRPVKLKPDQQYQEIGIYCFGRGIFHKTPRTGLEVGDKNLYELREGDLILQVTFAWEGAIALCSEAENGLFGSTRYPTFRVDETRCYAPFLVRYLGTRDGLDQINKICPGSAGRNRVLSLKRIHEVMVPLPPVLEQRRIVARIEELAAKINEARGLREKAAEESQSFWERGASTVLDAVADRYSKKRLADLVTIRGGGTPSKSNPYYWDGPVPWVTPKDMKVREIKDSIDHISEYAAEESPAKLINPGAVLVVVRGMILTHTFPSAVLRVRAAINQDMKALIPNDEIVPEFLCAFLWATNAASLELIEKSTHDTRKLETEKLLAISMPVPPVPEQLGIVRKLDAMQAKVDELQNLQTGTAAELDALLPSILDKAFKGEL